jgi:hypothetical protein
MTLVALCGANLWATIVFVPALWAGTPLSRLVALVPLAALGVAAARRSDRWLFGIFPAALALGALVQPAASGLMVRPAALALGIAALLAYLLVAARAAAQVELASLPAQATRPLPAAPRREPAARLIVGFAALGPFVLLHAAILRPHAQSDLAAHHATQPAAAGTLAVCAAGALWVGLVLVYVRAALPGAGEAERLRAELAAARATLRRGRAGPLFYASAVAALAGMATLVYLRYR